MARLLRRFDERRQELIIRAEERKAEIRERFRKQEEEERDDLNLRLRHMEEDYLLDVKHMREQYEMDIEEAARARDWRAIRTLQRRYGLESKQRKEDYLQQRRQFIESWEARHKQRQEDMEDELKDIEDNLQKQLEALEREKRREMDELRKRRDERRDELKAQYAQEEQDLQDALERRVADIIVAAVQEGTIRTSEASKVVADLAHYYDLDQQNLENMVGHDLIWLNIWASRWEEALNRIAAARSGIYGAMVSPHPYPTQPFAFAKGGMGIATKPTLVKVGEAGPELFTAIPLARGGSVLGGLRTQVGGDFRLTIDGNQSTYWSADFERKVEGVVADMFKEAYEE